MKRLVRRLLLLGIVVAVVWWVRERMVPPPQLPGGSPPPFRHAPPPAPPPAEVATAPTADDLTRVKGIGPVYRSRLAEEGVTTFAELVAADADALSEALDVPPSRVEDWQDQARSLD